MPATLFLSPPPPPQPPPPSLQSDNRHYFSKNSNPISHSYFTTSLSLNRKAFGYAKPIPSSKTLVVLSVSSCPCTTASTPTINSVNAAVDNGTGKINSPDSDNSFSAGPGLRSEADFKVPTAPWMKGSLVLRRDQVLDLSKPRKNKNSTNGEGEKDDQSLTGKVSGGRGKKAMKKIFEGIGKLQETDRLQETDKSLEEVEFDFSFGDSSENGDPKSRGKVPWERDERIVFRRTKKEKAVTAAELSLDGELLERLRGEAARMRTWITVEKAGVTQIVVHQIRLIWKDNELAMLKFGLPLCRNMDRAREIVETKTRGLVVWSKKDALVVYRGCNYQLELTSSPEMHSGFAGSRETSCLNITNHKLKVNIIPFRVKLSGSGSTAEENMSREAGKMEIVPMNVSLYEKEADRLLDGLGPRFIDWWRPKPLPVDADLLPEVVPGFQPPSRLCLPHVKVKLTDDELTYLRKLARPLPTHFVLGRNRKLQGLAAAILKLWEKSHIVKIAVKWGIPNTDNAQMAYELKCLTGGVLLLRNKFLIILYRGKDFLPCRVADVLVGRRMELDECQLQEESARLKAIGSLYSTDKSSANTSLSGTLSEFENIQSGWANLKSRKRDVEVKLGAEKERLEKQLRNQKRKLSILKMKIERSAMELLKLNSGRTPSELDADQEIITPEERECLRKIGLKMDSSLVLGRRGVFDGVIEGLHQHWKHREIVKVITMQRLPSQIIYTAKQLEAESGGILVSLDKLKEGHAIILYRGKNYRRPLNLVAGNLLNKNEALQRSLELQRIGSLKFFAYQREKEISELKRKLADLEARRADQSEWSHGTS